MRSYRSGSGPGSGQLLVRFDGMTSIFHGIGRRLFPPLNLPSLDSTSSTTRVVRRSTKRSCHGRLFVLTLISLPWLLHAFTLVWARAWTPRLFYRKSRLCQPHGRWKKATPRVVSSPVHFIPGKTTSTPHIPRQMAVNQPAEQQFSCKAAIRELINRLKRHTITTTPMAGYVLYYFRSRCSMSTRAETTAKVACEQTGA